MMIEMMDSEDMDPYGCGTNEIEIIESMLPSNNDQHGLQRGWTPTILTNLLPEIVILKVISKVMTEFDQVFKSMENATKESEKEGNKGN